MMSAACGPRPAAPPHGLRQPLGGKGGAWAEGPPGGITDDPPPRLCPRCACPSPHGSTPGVRPLAVALSPALEAPFPRGWWWTSAGAPCCVLLAHSLPWAAVFSGCRETDGCSHCWAALAHVRLVQSDEVRRPSRETAKHPHRCARRLPEFKVITLYKLVTFVTVVRIPPVSVRDADGAGQSSCGADCP